MRGIRNWNLRLHRRQQILHNAGSMLQGIPDSEEGKKNNAVLTRQGLCRRDTAHLDKSLSYLIKGLLTEVQVRLRK